MRFLSHSDSTQDGTGVNGMQDTFPTVPSRQPCPWICYQDHQCLHPGLPSEPSAMSLSQLSPYHSEILILLSFLLLVLLFSFLLASAPVINAFPVSLLESTSWSLKTSHIIKREEGALFFPALSGQRMAPKVQRLDVLQFFPFILITCFLEVLFWYRVLLFCTAPPRAPSTPHRSEFLVLTLSLWMLLLLS